jgi:hypothetical protein
MASFDTLLSKNLNRPSYGEIQDFAIHLKVRFGDKAVSMADYFVQQHRQAGDLLRTQMWQSVSESLNANDAAHRPESNRVNSLH